MTNKELFQRFANGDTVTLCDTTGRIVKVELPENSAHWYITNWIVTLRVVRPSGDADVKCRVETTYTAR